MSRVRKFGVSQDTQNRWYDRETRWAEILRERQKVWGGQGLSQTSPVNGAKPKKKHRRGGRANGGVHARTESPVTDPSLAANVVECTIDGGISFNPGGQAYGSFYYDGEVYRRTFGKGRGQTNNTAEVEIACEAIEWLAENVSMPHSRPVVFYTDSDLLCRWINRNRNPKTGQTFRLVQLLERFRRQAKAFKSVEMVWHARENSVAVLGH